MFVGRKEGRQSTVNGPQHISLRIEIRFSDDALPADKQHSASYLLLDLSILKVSCFKNRLCLLNSSFAKRIPAKDNLII
jgi:hypothetical protein